MIFPCSSKNVLFSKMWDHLLFVQKTLEEFELGLFAKIRFCLMSSVGRKITHLVSLITVRLVFEG